jgi:glycosyltransferase involved in cell wall biosynthesis
MKRIYDKINFLVIPSLREGLPYTLLEAMAYKVPVLASSVGDIPLLVQDGITGHLVPPGDTEALVKCMNQLLMDPEKSRKMAEKAHRLVMEKYSADRMVSKTEEVYNNVLLE